MTKNKNLTSSGIAPAHQSLKLEVMQRHVDTITGSINAGPRRSTRY